MDQRRFVWLVVAALLAGATGWSNPGPAAAAVVASNAAPDFALRSSTGANLRLSEQRGQVVMVNFWATWCGPCREELPQLNRLYEKYQAAGFTLLGVNVDSSSKEALGMARRLGVQFPVLFDDRKEASRLYGLESMPWTALIDRNGKVRYVHAGYKPGYEKTYEVQVRELLKE
jgi:peroxiredoxin